MRDTVIIFITAPPTGFPEKVDIPGFFLEPLCSPLGIWIVRCLFVVVVVLIVGVCIYKYRHWDGKGK